PMDGAEVKELIAQRIALFRLRQYALQSEGQFAQPARLRPGASLRCFAQMRMLGKQAPPSACALLKASGELVAERGSQRLQIFTFHRVFRVHSVSSQNWLCFS